MNGGPRLLRTEFPHFWVPGRHLRLDREKMGSLGYSCIVIVSTVRVSHERRVITPLPFILSAARADPKLNRHIAKRLTEIPILLLFISPHSHVVRATGGCLQLLAQRCCGGSLRQLPGVTVGRPPIRTKLNWRKRRCRGIAIPTPLFSNGPAAVPEPD